MIFLLKLWIILVLIVTIIFSSYTGLYYCFSKKPLPKFKEKIFPKVTLIIPFYNEEIVMKTKIKNTSKIRYPRDKLEVLFLNDHSDDQSVDIIRKEVKILPFKFKIVDNLGNRGKPNALNYIFPKLKNEITIITDTDSLIKEDAIENLVQNFQNKEVGGANARIILLKPEAKNKSYNEENSYRFFYDLWRKGESNIHSISVCNGPLMAFRTRLLRDANLISRKGASADDTQLTFHIIKNGYRVLYDTSSIVYEISPLCTHERSRQKMRRFRGLMKVYLNNLNIFGKSKFGWIIYPYTLLIHFVVPVLVSIGCILYLILLFEIPYLVLLALGLFIPKIGSFVLSFIKTQFIMVLSPFIAKGWNTAKSSREEMIK